MCCWASRASRHQPIHQDETVGDAVACDFQPTEIAHIGCDAPRVLFQGADQEWVVNQALRDFERLGHDGYLILRRVTVSRL